MSTSENSSTSLPRKSSVLLEVTVHVAVSSLTVTVPVTVAIMTFAPSDKESKTRVKVPSSSILSVEILPSQLGSSVGLCSTDDQVQLKLPTKGEPFTVFPECAGVEGMGLRFIPEFGSSCFLLPQEARQTTMAVIKKNASSFLILIGFPPELTCTDYNTTANMP